MNNKIDEAAEALLQWVGEEELNEEGLQRYRRAVRIVLEKLDISEKSIDTFDKIQHMQQRLNMMDRKIKEFQEYNLTTATAIKSWYERGERRMDAIVKRLNNPAP